VKGKIRVELDGSGNDVSGKDYLPGPPRPDGDVEVWETPIRIAL
jgi:hypothetical protein